MEEYQRWLAGEDVTTELDLLRRLAAQFNGTHSCPPPADHRRWSDEAVDDLLADLIVKKGAAVVLAALVEATDQDSLERYLLATIDHFLQDQAKSTPRGLLRGRLETLLTADPRFVRTVRSGDGRSRRSQLPPGRATGRSCSPLPGRSATRSS